MIITNEGQANQKTTVRSHGTRITEYLAFIARDDIDPGVNRVMVHFVRKEADAQLDLFEANFKTDWVGLYASLFKLTASYIGVSTDTGKSNENHHSQAWVAQALTLLALGE